MCEEVPQDGHVVRYVKPSFFDDDGTVTGSAFHLRKGEPCVSVNWLEWFEGLSKSEQVRRIASLSRLTLKPNGGYAMLNVGNVLGRLSEARIEVRIMRCPLPEDDEHEADLSHCGIAGLPPSTDMVQNPAALDGDSGGT